MVETVTTRKTGGSIVLAIPAPYARAIGLIPGETVEVRLRRTILEVRRKPVESLLRG
jgi:antitoxin component of MazEF toxin-antitoxin module